MDCPCSVNHMRATAPWSCPCECHNRREPVEPEPTLEETVAELKEEVRELKEKIRVLEERAGDDSEAWRR